MRAKPPFLCPTLPRIRAMETGLLPPRVLVRYALRGNREVQKRAEAYILSNPDMHAVVVTLLARHMGRRVVAEKSLHQAVSVIATLRLASILCIPFNDRAEVSVKVSLVRKGSNQRAREILSKLLPVVNDTLSPVVQELLDS